MNAEEFIENIGLKNYLKMHSPGYVIEIFKNNKKYEIVIGNRLTKPIIEKVTSETLYDIASLTKVFTSVLCYMAYEEQLLDLNGSIYSVDNNFLKLKEVTVLDLLSHNQNVWTSGYLGSANSKEEFYKILYTAHVKENIPTYVDNHYIILGVLLEKIYGMSYERLCQEKIFSVLDMKNTTFNPDYNLCASNNYECIGNNVEKKIYPGLIHDTKARIAKQYKMNLGHASIFSTGKDLMLFLETFFNNKLLKRETLKIMLSHRNTNEENYKILTSNYREDDINLAYKKMLKSDTELLLPRTYNNMGVRYRNIISAVNDVPEKASSNSITFSGYTGPMFTIDFDNKIIVLIMCNIIHNSKLNKDERKSKTIEIMNKIFDSIMSEKRINPF